MSTTRRSRRSRPAWCRPNGSSAAASVPPDAGTIRAVAPRAFTQEISRYVFETVHEHHNGPICGIGYLSRLGDEIENWAIFEPSQPDDATSRPIERADPDLQIALEKFDLAIA